MLYLQIFLAAFAVFSGVLFTGLLMTGSRAVIRSRLASIGRAPGLKAVEAEGLSIPFNERVIRPLLENCGRTVRRFAPRSVQRTVERRLVQAGHPNRLQTGTFLGVMALSALALPAVTLLLGMTLALPVRIIIGLMMLMGFAGLFIPWFWLSKKATERQQAVDLALPDAIDLLVVSVEAGLAFDMALAKVTEKMQGPLPNEFARALNEIRLGKLRRAALKDMADRVGAKTLSSFINTVVQGTQMGVSLGNMLRVQSERVRQERRQRAQEMAMKAPIKMLFPMIFFIFPALFVVLLGPAAIRMIHAFMNM